MFVWSVCVMHVYVLSMCLHNIFMLCMFVWSVWCMFMCWVCFVCIEYLIQWLSDPVQLTGYLHTNTVCVMCVYLICLHDVFVCNVYGVCV